MGIGEVSALLAALIIAISSVINKYLTRRMAVVPLNATRTTGASVFLLALFFLSGRADEIPAIDEGSLLLIVAGGLVTTLTGDTIFLRFLRTVDVAKTTTMAQALSTLLMVGIGALILDEDVTVLTFTGAGFVIVGVSLLGQTTSSSSSGQARSLLGFKSFLTLLLVVSLWVTGLSFMREGLREVDAITGNVARMVVISGFLMIALGARQGPTLTSESSPHAWARRMAQPNVSFHPSYATGHKAGTSPGRHGSSRGVGSHTRVLHTRVPRADRLSIGLGVLSGAMSLGLGTTLMFVAFKEAGAAITMVLFNSQLLILAPLSMIVLKERLNLKAGIGILVTVGGIIIVLL